MAEKDSHFLIQKVSLDEELRTASKLIELGVIEYKKISPSNDFYHLPIHLLSSGFERLMKCIICISYLDNNKIFPKFDDPTPDSLKLKQFGHDLIKLKKTIISECISKEESYEKDAIQEDYDFLSSDEQLDVLLDRISRFGRFARYDNLDIVIGEKEASDDFDTQWKEFEMEILKENRELFMQYLESEGRVEVYSYINTKILSILLRFARALARQFTLGGFANTGKQFSHHLNLFINLQDTQIEEATI